MRFPIPQGDRRPALQIQAFNGDGSERDLSSETSLLFRMAVPGSPDGVYKVNAAATPVVASRGIVEYRWQEGDTDTEGEFLGKFVFSGDDTYPKEGFIVIVVGDTL